MLLVQQFKTLEGVLKRARFENAHCANRYVYSPVRCVNGVPDVTPLGTYTMKDYTWRLRKERRMGHGTKS
jgi:hypothetical protein